MGRKAELLPCPFCGGRPHIYKGEHGRTEGKWFVECGNGLRKCLFIIGGPYEKRRQAVEAWNRRDRDGQRDKDSQGV